MKKMLLSVAISFGLLCCAFTAGAVPLDIGVYASATKAMAAVPVGMPSYGLQAPTTVAERQMISALARTYKLTVKTDLIGAGSGDHAKGPEVTLAAFLGKPINPTDI